VLGLVPEREGDAHEIHHEPPTARDRRNIIMILGVTMTLTLIAVTAFVTALPKLVETLDLGTREGLTRVGLLTGAIYLAASGAQFVGGHYADRGAARRTYLGSFALLAAVFVAAALTDNWLLVPLAVAVGLTLRVTVPLRLRLGEGLAEGQCDSEAVAQGVAEGVGRYAIDGDVGLDGEVFENLAKAAAGEAAGRSA
jgi:MFS family permease